MKSVPIDSKQKKSDPRSLAGRPAEKSKLLGQVVTPTSIASQMISCLLDNRPNGAIKVLDPSVGPFTFPNAMIAQGLIAEQDDLTIIDIDGGMIRQSRRRAANSEIHLQSITGDYLDLEMTGKYDYVVLNPPYIRQEWLERKLRYQESFKRRYGITLPGTSNLYVYFIVKVLMDLKPGGRFACIVYDSWQSTHYGRWLMEFMDSQCENIQVETLPDRPFDNQLINATIIYGKKKDGHILLKSGTTNSFVTMNSKSLLFDVHGFEPIENVFSTRRGLRLKQADFFLCGFPSGQNHGATPFLKKVGKLPGYCVPDSHPEAALLLNSKEKNGAAYSELLRRIALAKKQPTDNVSILTWFRERPQTWFIHPSPPYAPIVFNYYLRNRPRHIYNPSRAYADNFYGLTPPSSLSPIACLAVLNSTAVCAEILANSRNQGSGLAKIQLFEYRKVYVPDLRQYGDSELSSFESLGRDLIELPQSNANTIARIDALIADIYSDPRLMSNRIVETLKEVDQKARRPRED